MRALGRHASMHERHAAWPHQRAGAGHRGLCGGHVALCCSGRHGGQPEGGGRGLAWQGHAFRAQMRGRHVLWPAVQAQCGTSTARHSGRPAEGEGSADGVAQPSSHEDTAQRMGRRQHLILEDAASNSCRVSGPLRPASLAQMLPTGAYMHACMPAGRMRGRVRRAAVPHRTVCAQAPDGTRAAPGPRQTSARALARPAAPPRRPRRRALRGSAARRRSTAARRSRRQRAWRPCCAPPPPGPSWLRSRRPLHSRYPRAGPSCPYRMHSRRAHWWRAALQSCRRELACSQ